MQCWTGCHALSRAMSHCQAFLEGLLDAYCTEVGGSRQHSDRALMLSAAAVELLRGHPLLADHAVGLGYVERLLKLLSARLPPKPQGKFSLRTAAPSLLRCRAEEGTAGAYGLGFGRRRRLMASRTCWFGGVLLCSVLPAGMGDNMHLGHITCTPALSCFSHLC